MRFIQMWFFPSKRALKPSVEQKAAEKKDRTNRFLLLVSKDQPDALRIFSDANVYSCFLQARRRVEHRIKAKRGGYLYVLEGGPVKVNGHRVPALGAAKLSGEMKVAVDAEKDTELLLVDVLL
jgi:redox-sensitive bicupin YhaK (pirin superfamily)